MNIIQIVNKQVLTIENCESEPIHIPGSIQPHGMLLAIIPASGVIRYCSANTLQFIDKQPAEILDQPLSAIHPALWGKVQPLLDADNSPFHPINAGDLQTTIHESGEFRILSIEKRLDQINGPDYAFDQARGFIGFIERSRDLKELCQNIAVETARFTGFDRGMIYRFDKEYNGEVFAEYCREGLPPYLDLHYPHTDIPPQARELYLHNLLRLIPDVQYDPVPLLTVATEQVQQLDLSNVGLRSVSPIHVQYLKNMGVGASMSVSIIMEGNLWGLIACHHSGPLHLTAQQKRAALLQGHFLSSQIRVQQVAEEHAINLNVEAHLQLLMNRIDHDEDLSQKFEQFSSLLSVTNSTGVVILNEGKIYKKGLVPSMEKVLGLIRWVGDHVKSSLFSTNCLSKRYPDGIAMSKYGSGVIFHAMGKPTDSCVIWFREELERTVKWAGRPDSAVQKNVEGGPLTPRKSFEIWKESVKYQSAEFRASEINAAIRFATSLQNHFHLTYLRNEENRLRMLNERLQQANQELSNINWITSHDMKEPLRKIQLMSSRIVYEGGDNLSEAIKVHIEKIRNSASRMQHLVDDILSYSMMNNRNNMFTLSNLEPIISHVRGELEEELAEKKGLLSVQTMPQNLRIVPHQMEQLFSNLISNAIKFARPGVPPEIYINYQAEKGRDILEVALPADKSFYCIRISDNGLGFEPRFNEKIFDIFYRLHDRNIYQGTGIGLAICKKIMENHQGAITASGEAGRGAIFRVYLPVG
ncbi:ATP-binding protein [Chitinophaga sancti]|uniref:ATP-binding protein n=1 Tax=Chitinophaga sancti TaxID=1004 RepID=UPI002A75A346|nr:ATP-binding protein [Chitinophaga sancti]WPQ60901.1 ATP-binding protein [Chitinophaga sancti]